MPSSPPRSPIGKCFLRRHHLAHRSRQWRNHQEELFRRRIRAAEQERL